MGGLPQAPQRERALQREKRVRAGGPHGHGARFGCCMPGRVEELAAAAASAEAEATQAGEEDAQTQARTARGHGSCPQLEKSTAAKQGQEEEGVAVHSTERNPP